MGEILKKWFFIQILLSLFQVDTQVGFCREESPSRVVQSEGVQPGKLRLGVVHLGKTRAKLKGSSLYLYKKSLVSRGSGEVFLGDIARISPPPRRTGELEKLVMARFSRGEKSLQLSRGELLQRLGPHLSKLPPIPESVQVDWVATQWSRENVSRLLQRKFEKLCPPCRIQLQIHPGPFHQKPAPLRSAFPKLAHGTPGLRPGEIRAWGLEVSRLPRGNFSLVANIFYEEGGGQRLWLQGHVKAMAYLPVAREVIPRGRILRGEDISLQLRELPPGKRGIFSREESLGKELQKTLARGEVILPHYLQKPPLVKAGDLVRVDSGNSVLQVSLDGIVQQRAHRGDIVQVKLLRTKKTVRAQVLRPGVVQLR